ncbi:hypothetical protein [Streptomyces sp. NPDC093589]|uniref:hypothetical protein n=1 Tax=Streptomyces sp. NPDC093589 TaxID=3366043 RepID=UPI00382EDAC4
MANNLPEPAVTITRPMLEQALRSWLAYFEYDLHKSLECNEESGEDTYPEEAETFFEHLQRVADV